MPDVPTVPNQDGSDDDDQPKMQGYQDDLDTSQRDQFANEEATLPYEDTPATREELKEGLNDTEGADQEGGSTKPTDDSDRQDDYREEVEGRDQDGDDNKDRDQEPWQ